MTRSSEDPAGRILAVDFGDRRTGVAVCDAHRIGVVPLEVVEARSPAEAAEALAGIVAREEVGQVLLGLPLRSDGTEGTRARTTRAFAALLAPRITPVPIVTFDERWTTKEAESRRRDAYRRGAKLKAANDSLAACVLLEAYLASLERPV